jgi:hypothetical protein
LTTVVASGEVGVTMALARPRRGRRLAARESACMVTGLVGYDTIQQ